MKKDSKEESMFIQCDCYTHALHLLKFPEEEQLYISIWESSPRSKMSFCQRLRNCWKILYHGSPYGDQVVLSKEKSLILANYLKSLYGSCGKFKITTNVPKAKSTKNKH